MHLPSRPFSLRSHAPSLPSSARLLLRFDSAARWIRVGSLAEHGGWLLFFLVLAPIIGPHDYGLFVIAASGIAVAEAALSETAAQTLIRHPDPLPGHVSAAFVSVVAVAAAVSLALYAIAGTAAATFDDSVIGDIVQSLSLLPLLGALTVPPAALLRRRAAFAPLAASRAAGIVAGGIVAVVFAMAGAGPWSLVTQLIVQRFVEIVLLWAIAGRTIGLWWSPRDVVELAASFDLVGLAAALKAAGRHLPALLAGLVLGPVAAALYLIGARLLQALSDILLLPLTAAVARHGVDDVTRRAAAAVLPALAAIVLLPIALPGLLDLRWWGAVFPAQLMVAATIPGAVLTVCTLAFARHARAEAKAEIARAVTGLAVFALVIPSGLTAAALAVALHAAAAAAIGLCRRWRSALRGAAPDVENSPLERLTKGLATAALVGTAVAFIAAAAGDALQPLPACLLLLGIAVLGQALLSGGNAARPSRG